jgi:hypothetical protein
MEKLKKECAVTGKEVLNPSQAPRSDVNGKVISFCCSTCKDYFDRYLVKFARKLYPANDQSAYSTILNPKNQR